VRIGILNQLNEAAVTDIVSRFADAMLGMGAVFEKQAVLDELAAYYAQAKALEAAVA
jgi:hypothetical protein